jgi:hypothetical protein
MHMDELWSIVNYDQGLFWIKTDKGIRFVNTLPVVSKNKQANLRYDSDPDKERFTDKQLQQISNVIGSENDTGMIPIILNGKTQATILSFTGMNEQEMNKKILDYEDNHKLYHTLLDIRNPE